MYIYIYVYIHICIGIYIYIERERDVYIQITFVRQCPEVGVIRASLSHDKQASITGASVKGPSTNQQCQRR